MEVWAIHLVRANNDYSSLSCRLPRTVARAVFCLFAPFFAAWSIGLLSRVVLNYKALNPFNVYTSKFLIDRLRSLDDSFTPVAREQAPWRLKSRVSTARTRKWIGSNWILGASLSAGRAVRPLPNWATLNQSGSDRFGSSLWAAAFCWRPCPPTDRRLRSSTWQRAARWSSKRAPITGSTFPSFTSARPTCSISPLLTVFIAGRMINQTPDMSIHCFSVPSGWGFDDERIVSYLMLATSMFSVSPVILKNYTLESELEHRFGELMRRNNLTIEKIFHQALIKYSSANVFSSSLLRISFWLKGAKT